MGKSKHGTDEPGPKRRPQSSKSAPSKSTSFRSKNRRRIHEHIIFPTAPFDVEEVSARLRTAQVSSATLVSGLSSTHPFLLGPTKGGEATGNRNGYRGYRGLSSEFSINMLYLSFPTNVPYFRARKKAKCGTGGQAARTQTPECCIS